MTKIESVTSQKKILILGGGYYNLPLIKKSVELGYYTIVAGIAGNYPGYKYATKWVDVDIFNRESVLAVARQYAINGVIATGSDTIMSVIGFIVDKMDVLGPTEKSAIAATNKSIMKNLFVENGVRTAKYQKVFTLQEAKLFAANNGYPVVLKVVDACGGRGIAIVNNVSELDSCYSSVHNETKLDYMIVEEYVRGEEFGAQAFVRNGKLMFVMPHGDMVYHALTDVPIGHYVPYERAEELNEDIRTQLELCVKALGIDNTAINADFILSNGQVYVLEIGARAGATCLPELVSQYYGIDYYEYLLRNCVGEFVDFPVKGSGASLVETLISTTTGRVKSIEIGEMPSEVVSYEIYPKEGDFVHTFRNAYDRIGTMVMRGESVDGLFELRENLIKFEIDGEM